MIENAPRDKDDNSILSPATRATIFRKLKAVDARDEQKETEYLKRPRKRTKENSS